jgi:hypothetical protein
MAITAKTVKLIHYLLPNFLISHEVAHGISLNMILKLTLLLAMSQDLLLTSGAVLPLMNF